MTSLGRVRAERKMSMNNPFPGHIPGYHAPGTLIPMGAIHAQQQQQAAEWAYQQAVRQAALEKARKDEEVALLLLLS